MTNSSHRKNALKELLHKDDLRKCLPCRRITSLYKNISLICVPIRCMKISKTYIIHVSRYLSNVHRNNKWKLIRTRLTNFWLSRKKMYFLDLSLIGNLTPII